MQKKLLQANIFRNTYKIILPTKTNSWILEAVPYGYDFGRLLEGLRLLPENLEFFSLSRGKKRRIAHCMDELCAEPFDCMHINAEALDLLAF